MEQPHSGEVGIEIAPVLDTDSADADLADRIDALLRRACKLATVSLAGAPGAVLPFALPNLITFAMSAADSNPGLACSWLI